MIRFIFLLLIYCFVLSACTTAPKGPENAVNLTVQLEKVAQVQQWEMRGKIAFRQGKDAASL
ncbi:MAG: outer membrane lipoprotein LolB, partial [Pseudomonadota bacterium]|nr:outer membrane lipoprotein LolB [Pseudomonadota bacterium]